MQSQLSNPLLKLCGNRAIDNRPIRQVLTRRINQGEALNPLEPVHAPTITPPSSTIFVRKFLKVDYFSGQVLVGS